MVVTPNVTFHIKFTLAVLPSHVYCELFAQVCMTKFQLTLRCPWSSQTTHTYH